MTIYKIFVRPILDYADIIYDKSLTESFKDKLEMVQYNAALVITGAFKGTSSNRIYRELGLEFLAEQRWSRKIFFFHKIINGLLPVYLQSISVTVVKEFIEQDQQIKSTLDNSLQEQKYMSHLFFLIVLKSGIILVRSFGKLNQQFNLKQKFSVSSDPRKTRFLRFMT